MPITAGLFLRELKSLIDGGEVSKESRVLLVDDGSSDSTWNIITKLSKDSIYFEGIKLSRNRGHQNALFAGLMECKNECDATISIDCDGQDDISAIGAMVKEYSKGYEVVYGVRSSRDTDSFMKRFTAESFYKVLNALGADVVYNHADYRLLGSRALDALSHYHEVNLYLRGMVPLLGFKSCTVEYERAERVAGSSHYPFSKMVHLAWDGITSLSTKPLHFIAILGFVVSLIGLFGVIWAIVSFAFGITVAGWSSVVCIICLLGGLQIFSLGIIGEYVGKLYLESKHRPRFYIESRTWVKEE